MILWLPDKHQCGLDKDKSHNSIMQRPILYVTFCTEYPFPQHIKDLPVINAKILMYSITIYHTVTTTTKLRTFILVAIANVVIWSGVAVLLVAVIVEVIRQYRQG